MAKAPVTLCHIIEDTSQDRVGSHVVYHGNGGNCVWFACLARK